MVQEPRLCIEILQQLAAAEAALNRISLAVFKHHVDSCVTDGVSKGEPERRKQLTELVDTRPLREVAPAPYPNGPNPGYPRAWI